MDILSSTLATELRRLIHRLLISRPPGSLNQRADGSMVLFWWGWKNREVGKRIFFLFFGGVLYF